MHHPLPLSTSSRACQFNHTLPEDSHPEPAWACALEAPVPVQNTPAAQCKHSKPSEGLQQCLAPMTLFLQADLCAIVSMTARDFLCRTIEYMPSQDCQHSHPGLFQISPFRPFLLPNLAEAFLVLIVTRTDVRTNQHLPPLHDSSPASIVYSQVS